MAGNTAINDVAPRFTTLRFHDVPRKWSTWDMKRQLELFFLRPEFDYVYVPWDQAKSKNMGIAFVNFVDHATAVRAMSTLADTPWLGGASPDRCIGSSPARLQGQKENLSQFNENAAKKGATAMRKKPLVFKDGARVPLLTAIQRCYQDFAAEEQPSAEEVVIPERFRGHLLGVITFSDPNNVSFRSPTPRGHETGAASPSSSSTTRHVPSKEDLMVGFPDNIVVHTGDVAAVNVDAVDVSRRLPTRPGGESGAASSSSSRTRHVASHEDMMAGLPPNVVLYTDDMGHPIIWSL